MARRHTIHQAPHTRAPFYGEMIHMQINKVAFIGKGGVGLLYGSMIAQALGNDAVEYVMDDARFERHAGDALTVNGKPCALKSVRASEATPADLVILTVKTTGLDQALKTMEHIVGPKTLIASLCNGITSEQKIAERFGWEHTVLGICQGMDAVFLNGALTFTNAGEIRFGAAPAPTPRPSPLSTGSTRAAASPTPSRTTSPTACGQNLCSTTASTRPAWPTEARTEAPRNRAPSSVVALSPPCARRLRSPTPRVSSSPRQT